MQKLLKHMKSKIFIALTFLSVLIATYSCFNGKEIGRCNFTEEQKQLIPYYKGQIISFIYNTEKNIDLTVTGNILDWVNGRPEGSQHDYIKQKRKFVTLRSDQNNLEITLILYAGNCLSDFDYHSWFSISINNGEVGNYILELNSAGSFLSNNYTFFHNSLKINDINYYNVVENKYNKEIFDGKGGRYEVLMQLFYNKTYGILQVNRDGNNFLTINH